MNFLNAEKSDVQLVGRQFIDSDVDEFESFEAASQHIVQTLFRELRRPDGEAIFALLRIFRFGSRNELPANARDLVGPVPMQYWLALMGTVGIEPAWCDRRSSRGHKAIPADSPATPMLKAAFAQVGLSFGTKQSTLLYQTDNSQRYFYVSQAHESRFVPVQNEFVIPYQIQSVIGFGGAFESGNGYLLIGFTTASFDKAHAAMFASLNPYVSGLLQRYDPTSLWNE